jgi:uncharacterized DUF497 family protein
MIALYKHPETCCSLTFSWDENKAQSNMSMRGRPTFQLASHVFHDPTALTDFNRLLRGEDREQTLGKIGHTNYFVVHTEKVF